MLVEDITVLVVVLVVVVEVKVEVEPVRKKLENFLFGQ